VDEVTSKFLTAEQLSPVNIRATTSNKGQPDCPRIPT